MTADALMKRMFEYSTSLNNCCAYVKDCVYTGKCLVDEDIVGCSQRNDFKKVKEALDAKPVRHGRWEFGENEYGDDGYYCSACHGHVVWKYDTESIDFIKEYNYCPFCGAKMDERKEE